MHSSNTTSILREVYLAEIDKCLKELEQYPSDASLWTLAPGTLNSGGNLILHLAGNLLHFIGHTLGNSGYVRDREREFGAKDLSREQLRQELAEAREQVDRVLNGLYDQQLDEPYPIREFKGGKTIGYVLQVFLAHFSYHLGQLNYHRRITT
ncbi:MAG TPA: DUF1572 family protein [Chitinophagales bacterium]|nr:DUF1572 family protein [Chitinophagales bacterium]